MSGPKLSDEEQAALDQMLANREKARARYAEQGAPKPRADSPLVDKWQKDGFLGSSDDRYDRAWQIDQLQSPDARSRAYMLRMLAATPVADAELLALAERLLDDRAMTLLNIPNRFGEVRWNAADAVAALRGALGRAEAVTLDDVFEPVASAESLAREAGIDHSRREGIDGTIETLERLARMGALPRQRITREPSSQRTSGRNAPGYDACSMRARTPEEIDVYIRRHPCQRCGTPTSASELQFSGRAVGASDAHFIYRGDCKKCGSALLFEFDGPNGWPELGALAYGGPEPSVLLTLDDWLDEANQRAARVPDDPGTLEPRAYFTHNGEIRTAIAMLEEAKKYPGAPHDKIDARIAQLAPTRARYAALRDEMVERDRASRPERVPKATFGGAALKAHAAWLARGKTGDGRLDLEATSLMGMPLGSLKVAGARMHKVIFDGAMIDFAHFEDAELIECSARRTRFPHTKFDRARLDRCNFEGAGLVLTDFQLTTIVGGDFRRINADRGFWQGITMKAVDLREARFGDCVLDGAVIENCDLRDADLSRVSMHLTLCTATNTTFRNCDMRGANLEGRRLRGTQFINCKLAGVRGKPAIEGPYTVERPDLSAAGDGSDVRSADAVYAMWGAGKP